MNSIDKEISDAFDAEHSTEITEPAYFYRQEILDFTIDQVKKYQRELAIEVLENVRKGVNSNDMDMPKEYTRGYDNANDATKWLIDKALEKLKEQIR